jgi:hypothetical protein
MLLPFALLALGALPLLALPSFALLLKERYGSYTLLATAPVCVLCLLTVLLLLLPVILLKGLFYVLLCWRRCPSCGGRSWTLKVWVSPSDGLEQPLRGLAGAEQRVFKRSRPH